MTMEMELTIRFGYGRIVPWVPQRLTLNAIAGPDGLSLWLPGRLPGRGLHDRGRIHRLRRASVSRSP